MRVEDALADIDVAVLAGGLGTRIRGVLGDTPKVLAPIAGRAFLSHLLDYLTGYGAQRVVLCLGHLADRVTAWLAQGSACRGLDVVCQIEPQPLGTAGALGFARRELRSPLVLVVNGDIVIDADLRAFVASHRLSGAEASILCVEVADAARLTRVDVGPDGRVRGFPQREPGRAVVDTGVYLFSAAFLDRFITEGAVALDVDVLEKAGPGQLHAHLSKGSFIDIGTPESLAQAARAIVGEGV